MKVGIVGSGFVGATAAYAMVMRGIGHEIVMIDVDPKRAQAQADDILHAVPFARPMQIRAGDYGDLANSHVVVITAGVNQKPGETRLQLLERNAAIFKEIVPQIVNHASQAVLLVATNPVDVMTHLTARFAAEYGVRVNRVMGSGTTLDTARFRTLLAQHLQVDARHIHGYVLGEHGDSEVLTWSVVSVAGIPIEEFCKQRNVRYDESAKKTIDVGVRRAAYSIIAGKGATYYGVGSAIARITEAVLHDQRSILTVCTPLPEIAGVANVTVSLPHLISGQGIIATFPPSLNEQEQSALHDSAAVVRNAIDSLGLEMLK
jgi:L-lactate dehydrogenase